MSEVLELASELISRPSLTPQDAGCQRLVADRLQAAGFDVEWIFCEDVSNVLITRGRGSPSLWFLGHTDVVPPGPEEDWASPPFEPDVRDGYLYGRGASDMKGAVAAMVIALEQFARRNASHAGQAGLLLTSDEEGIARYGIREVAKILSARKQAPDYCLVGEPSSQDRLGDTVRIGRRGSIAVRIEVDGIQGHTAFPHTIDNPVHRLAPFINELTSRHWDDGDDDFPPTHCQVSNINAGTGAENVTPGHAVLMFSLRNGPASPSARLEQELRNMLDRHGVDRYRLDFRISGEPFRSEPGALREALALALARHGIESTGYNTGGGTSDGRFIAPLGTEVVELGLVNRTIHQVNECAAVDDLEKLSDLYLSVITALLVQ